MTIKQLLHKTMLNADRYMDLFNMLL